MFVLFGCARQKESEYLGCADSRRLEEALVDSLFNITLRIERHPTDVVSWLSGIWLLLYVCCSVARHWPGRRVGDASLDRLVDRINVSNKLGM